jgi:hypothetical protein
MLRLAALTVGMGRDTLRSAHLVLSKSGLSSGIRPGPEQSRIFLPLRRLRTESTLHHAFLNNDGDGRESQKCMPAAISASGSRCYGSCQQSAEMTLWYAHATSLVMAPIAAVSASAQGGIIFSSGRYAISELRTLTGQE